MAGVEIHPGAKTCPMACRECVMHSAEGTVNILDENVARSFDETQRIFTNQDKPRHFQYAYRLSEIVEYPLPRIENLNNLSAVIIGFGNIKPQHTEHKEMVIRETMGKIDLLLGKISKHNRKDKNIGEKNINLQFTFATEGLENTEIERDFIFSFFEQLKLFAEKNKYLKVSIGCGDNIVSLKKYKEDLWKVTNKEVAKIKQYIGEPGLRSNLIDNESEDGKIYTGMYSVSPRNVIFENNYLFGKRVIAKKNSDIEEQRLRVSKKLEKTEYLSIFPHGIFINHAGVELQNPFLWTTHQKYLEAIEKNKRKELIDLYNSDINTILGNLVMDNIETYRKNGNKFGKQHWELVNYGAVSKK